MSRRFYFEDVSGGVADVTEGEAGGPGENDSAETSAAAEQHALKSSRFLPEETTRLTNNVVAKYIADQDIEPQDADFKVSE